MGGGGGKYVKNLEKIVSFKWKWKAETVHQKRRVSGENGRIGVSIGQKLSVLTCTKSPLLA